MKIGLITALIMFGSVLAVGQNCTPPGGGWTQSNRPPVGCTPYPNGLWVKPLPGAGNGGPMNHLAPNSDAVANCAMTDCGASSSLGGWAPATPGSDDLDGQPLFYGHTADPKYTITCQFVPNDGVHDPTGLAIHSPSGTKFANIGGSDQWLEVWDQTTNTILSLYKYHGDQVWPACGSGQTCAAPQSEYCGKANYSTDPGFKQGLNVGKSDSLGNAPFALTITADEWVAGNIPHAVYLNTDCEDTSTGPSFPGVGQARDCGSISKANTNRPKHGSLLFFDYTDAQINAMNLPLWQKPLIKAMSHYGGYQGDTGDGATHISRYESGQAYLLAGVAWPLQNFLGTVNGIHCTGPGNATGSQCRYSMGAFNGIPNVTGPNCPTSTCGVLQHAHIADPCVPLGLAGLPGGCVTAGALPPPAPSNLTTVVN